jgi:putative sporulation protein YyaC
MKYMMYRKSNNPVLYFKPTNKDHHRFSQALKTAIAAQQGVAKEPLFLCLGTDRLTGDCLGPLVGHKLNKTIGNRACIFGTLEYPVHALNLHDTLAKIRLSFSNPYVIVVDASLGLPSHIGNITLSTHPLFPGEGIHKKLPSVGDLSITGIVNSCHGNPTRLLQNTRLHLVNQLADFICTGLINNFLF